MKIYIAGASAESARAIRVAAELTAVGHHIVSTWTDNVASVGEANPRSASRIKRRQWSELDLEEVDDADLLLFLVPIPPAVTCGAWIEVGYAVAKGKMIISVGDTKQSIFTSLGLELTSDEQIAKLVGAWASGQIASDGHIHVYACGVCVCGALDGEAGR